MGNYLSTEEFVIFIASILDIDFDSYETICNYGRKRGWLESQEAEFSDWKIDKRSAARIVHEFIRTELSNKDIDDIKKATVLKDLYDCRVCANHIAQVYLKGIMKAKSENEFGLVDKVTKEEALDIIGRMKQL